jgi:hypothetical protein
MRSSVPIPACPCARDWPLSTLHRNPQAAFMDSTRQFVLVAIELDELARFSAQSTSLNGFESGGGHLPRRVLRLFRTRNSESLTQRGKRKEKQ